MSDTAVCQGCGKARGFVYVGPVYSVEELNDALCPWCIADGSAAEAFGASFTDVGWGVAVAAIELLEGFPNLYDRPFSNHGSRTPCHHRLSSHPVRERYALVVAKE